ncbi:MAG: hypothetical protein KGO47_07400 [Cyanobacteria bacterium REEB417]|nr:hypothetical protein [Cyanobacteria bacterium REEB417]
MITLSYNSATYTFPNLTDHPYGYDEGEVRRGRAVRRWSLTGIIAREDAATLASLFEAWNAAKFLEDDPARTGVVGATVAFTGKAPGFNWSTPVPCWFSGAPSIQMAGIYCRVSATVVDAAAALAVILRQGEEEAEQAAQLNLGTLTFGGAVVNLTARPDGFTDLPALSLTPSGGHMVTGPLQPTQTRRVQGWVTPANLTLLESWLSATAAVSPSTGAWFPVEWSEPVAQRRADGGTIGTYYDVSFTVAKIR